MAHFHLAAVAVAVAVVLLAVGGKGEASSIVGFDLHHRSSPVVRRWAEARGHPQLPAHGTPEYYSELSRHDRALLGRRGLAGAADGLVYFADGNATFRFSDLGFLYYAEVSLGTPKETFLVALDTGSDLFWVPCDCKQCAPPADNSTDLGPYSPRQSSTSKPVTCGHALCGRPNGCSAATNGSCPYSVRYLSANTSSSGVLVEDVLHLARDGGEAVEAGVVLGCGQVQTGQFLQQGVGGLLGLGLDKVSVPSVLAAKGLVAADSFSMCFSRDGVGRINFGDTGSAAQTETPFTATTLYNVSFTSINVGSESSPVEFTAVVDSGTSFTYLSGPVYTALATNFNSQVGERRTNLSAPFEYCYGISSGQTELQLPKVSLTTNNGRSVFPVLHPIITLATQVNGKVRPLGYCLAVLRNDIGINIIGQNFMTGLKVVFDRERSVLGWQEFDCYKNARAEGGQQNAASPGAAPAPSITPLKPRQNDGTPPSGSAACKLSLLQLLLLLPLLVAAALV